MRRAARWALAAALVVLPRVARADEPGPWVERPLILAPWTASFDLGVAAANVSSASLASVSGANLEAALGTPNLIELAVRTGIRPQEGARLAGSDTYARLFDHETTNVGGDTWANPEIRVRASLLFIGETSIGLEVRLGVPAASGTHFTASPGIPVRVRFGDRLRLDAGLHLLFENAPNTDYTFSAPLALWVQLGVFFAGPMTGLRYTHGNGERFDVQAGVGLGFTVAHRVDLKAQVYSPALKLDSDLGQTLGFGLGAGVTFP